MAGRRTAARSGKRRVNSQRSGEKRNRRTYEDGNAVRVPDIFDDEPRPVSREAARRQARIARDRREIMIRAERSRRRRVKRTRAQTRRARALGRSISAGYALTLAVVCVLTVFLCIHYLQLRSQVINQGETIAVMESSLNRLKADNDALENQTQASLNLEEIKDTALNKLGLHYAEESQIRYYNADDESYVRQYSTVAGN